MDFLKTFGENGSLKSEKVYEENMELNLCLSSNGRFGVDRRLTVANGVSVGLIRSSSVSDFYKNKSEIDDTTSLTLYSPLTRTCSLPVKTELEWRKWKELQSLRRSEAKRKRFEKIRNCETKKRKVSPPSLLPPLPRPVTASVGSPASGGSSGVSDLESQPFSGAIKDTELKSTATQQPVLHQIINRSNSTTSQIINRSNSTSSQIINGNPSKHQTLKIMFADMPCVSTKPDSVNGKKIEGFLYRYGKGEEVRIVCVCHGSFLTPAEFVKHGGGGDVEHPLRHIVVVPPSL